ncbi:MAG TPA: aminotransferase class V-fold PLP-dependent enzyme [Thermoanaerobaculia bacterium]|jgi:selenocysteine lyase/cysteine desulfurase|nr:aminotransferase class V-fold PLP-dependent enzyme [Thermoanaerobaculia bacterium]
MQDRRVFMKQALATAALAALSRRLRAALPEGMTPGDVARDETFWAQVREAYSPEPGTIWLNNLAFNPVPKSVHEAYLASQREINAWPLARSSRVFSADAKTALRARLARMLNATPDEVAFTRNTTEALNIVIFGLDLQRGDEVVITTHEYPSFRNAWRQRERRDGITVKRIAVPAPPRSADEIVALFDQAITARTRAVMLCHIVDPTGLMNPVRRIADLAHNRGAQVIVDGALGFGCLPVDVQALGCDYYGTSLHKGVNAPCGTGLLYVKKNRIEALWPLFGAPEDRSAEIRKFESIGTAPVAQWATMNAALDVHDALGSERIAARYRYLYRYWTERLSTVKGITFHTSRSPELSLSIGVVEVDGVDTKALYTHVKEKRGVSAWPIQEDEFQGLWVNPYLFTTPSELDRFVQAMTEVAAKGLPS